jgi:hypothetical protein
MDSYSILNHIPYFLKIGHNYYVLFLIHKNIMNYSVISNSKVFRTHFQKQSLIHKLNSVALVRKQSITTERRRMSAKLVRTSADGGCCVVSATDTHGR